MSEALNCNELVELVTEYFEDALSPEARQRFEDHVSRCSGCRNYLQQMRQTITLTGKLAQSSMSEAAQRELLNAFRDWKNEQVS